MPGYSYDVIQLRSNSLILFTQTEYYGNYSHNTLQKIICNAQEQQKKAYSGTMTAGAKKRLTKAIDLLIQSAKVRNQYNPITEKYQKHKLSFITLTISSQDNVTARQAYNDVFVHFLQWLRRTMKVTTYVWKVEVQQRGQMHYHITTPSFIHYQDIRDKWNNLQRAAGYLKEFESKYGHSDPNSTDIHGVRDIKNFTGYLIKEYCKSIQNPVTEGKLWDCSFNLKSSKYYSVEMQQHHVQLLGRLLSMEKTRTVELEQCSIIQPTKKELLSFLSLKEIKDYDDHLTAIRKICK